MSKIISNLIIQSGQFGMSKPVSKLIIQSVQNSRSHSAFGARNSPPSYIFMTDNNNRIQNKFTGLKFKSGGCQEDTKKWGLLSTMQGNNMPRMDICIKQKLVMVTTQTGEKVMAITCEDSSCYPKQVNWRKRIIKIRWRVSTPIILRVVLIPHTFIVLICTCKVYENKPW